MATTTQSTTTQPTRLTKYGYNAIARQMFLVVMVTVPLFLGANTFDWGWGWVYSIATLFGWIALSAVLARQNPDLLNQRGARARDMSGTKSWDWIILAFYFVLLLVIPFVAGLDYRYGWSVPVSPVINVTGIVLLLLHFVLLTWSMAVNRNFEGTVRIQEQRGHKVINWGPYRLMRHPGYSALVLSFISVPLSVGAWVGLLPALAAVVLFIVRTALEDRTLQAELPGYREYTQQTRYRLLPGVW